ncbi:MAG TPA: S-layer homology domain-containing protein [Fimbriimonas sp.]|nr:S-layer homology domain-containing protein [Fimbriimonas sp.]
MMLASGACLFAVAVNGQNPSSFPDNPKNHWAYEGISLLKSQGILVGYPDSIGFHGPSHQTRYEIAVAVHASFSHICKLEDELKSRFDRITRESTGSKESEVDVEEATKELQRFKDPYFRKGLSFIERATKEFDYEMRALGVDMESMESLELRNRSFIDSAQVPEPGASFKQFPDVPADHWAAKAVRELRADGILVGYPDGLFH